MKTGKYFRIPEGPADVAQLWDEARPLETSDLPSWLPPECAPGYRCLGTGSAADGRPSDAATYAAELEQLQAVGLIINEHPHADRAQRVYMAEPPPWEIWSIGIYMGDSLFRLRPVPEVQNPVLTHADVTDVPAVFVADPFMLPVNDTWYMFFEVMNWRTNKGEIGLAISTNGTKWEYQQIVLAEPFHLSYPYVFEWMNSVYMIPESHQAGSVRLYKALHFPTQWQLVATLLSGPYLVDASPFRYEDRWWLFAETNSELKHDTLRLYFADRLEGAWIEHPHSPIVCGNKQISRPGGRVLILGNKIVRYAQDCYPSYGTRVRAFEITELTPSKYHERAVEAPVLAPTGQGWNACGMHHLDVHLLAQGTWIACVDGWFSAEHGKASRHLPSRKGRQSGTLLPASLLAARAP